MSPDRIAIQFTLSLKLQRLVARVSGLMPSIRLLAGGHEAGSWIMRDCWAKASTSRLQSQPDGNRSLKAVELHLRIAVPRIMPEHRKILDQINVLRSRVDEASGTFSENLQLAANMLKDAKKVRTEAHRATERVIGCSGSLLARKAQKVSVQ